MFIILDPSTIFCWVTPLFIGMTMGVVTVIFVFLIPHYRLLMQRLLALNVPEYGAQMSLQAYQVAAAILTVQK